MKNNAYFSSFVAGGMMDSNENSTDGEKDENDEYAEEEEEEVKKEDIKKEESIRKPKLPPPKLDKDFGKFEKHTKGFGAKMLAKMGFKGRLGKNEQGIAAPIEVKVRPKDAGLGAVEEATRLKGNQEIAKDFWGDNNQEESDEEERGMRLIEEAKAELQKGWLLPEKGGKKKKARKYKTIEEMLEGAEQGLNATSEEVSDGIGFHHKPISQIVDMRGPEIKIISSLSDIRDKSVSSSVKKPDVAQELVYNVRLLADTSGNDLNMSVRQAASEKDKIVSLNVELEEAKEKIITLQDVAVQLRELVTVIDRVQAKLDDASSNISSTSLVDVFNLFQNKYKKLYSSHRLMWIAGEWLPPLLQKEFSEEFWDGFENPDWLNAAIAPWRVILIDNVFDNPELEEHSSTKGASEVIYQHIMTEIVFSSLRRMFTKKWNTSETRSGVFLIESFIHLTKGIDNKTLLSDIILSVILPRLMREVEAWDPLNDDVGIDKWLLPWASLVGRQSLNQLLPSIRQKMSKAIAGVWHAGDGSAQRLVKSWKGIWDARSLYAFLERCVVPSLIKAVHAINFLPSGNKGIDLRPFTAVLSWQGIISSIQLNAILKGEFFPRWLDFFENWLHETNPSKDLIKGFYFGWKSVMPVSVAQKLIDSSFSNALDAINRYIKKAPKIITRTSNANYEKALEEIRNNRSMNSMNVLDDDDDEEEDEGGDGLAGSRGPKFERRELQPKEIVEMFASKSGITFLPLGRNVGGKPVYSFFGERQINVYIDRNIVWYENKVGVKIEWKPVSLKDCLDMAVMKA